MSSSDPGVPFGNYQYEIYLRGMADEVPEQPVSWAALERKAHDVLDAGARGYVFGGAGTEDTQRENLEAFRRRRIVPRMLRDVSVRDLRTSVLDLELAAPLLCGPVGVQSIIHPEGELAVARACASQGVPMVASTASSFSLEEIAEANGEGRQRWFQLYWPRTKELTDSFVRRAEQAGYGAIVVTLDTPLLAWRPRDLETAYLPFLRSVGIANYLSDPVFMDGIDPDDQQAAVMRFVGVFSNPGATWEDLAHVRSITDLPLLVKGIQHAGDVSMAREAGVDGLIVSNHGGRQVDGAVASLDALPAVVEAAAGELPVLFDSGVRCGADIVKAIALGAAAVLLGRPYLWGLAVGGEQSSTSRWRSPGGGRSPSWTPPSWPDRPPAPVRSPP
jgi:lactate 2-monooxygenase